jgi:hypothetical protein
LSNFQPVNSNPTDGELITLCKILEAVSTGGGGGGDSDVAVGADGVTRVPLNVNAAGELKVNVEASIDADLADIENALATTNGILTTTAADTATIKNEAIAIDNKLPALSSGRVPVEANNAATQVYNYTITGALAASTVIIGPIDCSQFREVSVQVVSLGSGGTAPIAQVSNDGTNWISAPSMSGNGSFSNNLANSTISNVPLLNAKNFRVISQGTQTSGTTTLVAHASQTPTPKLYQSVTGNVTTQTTINGIALTGTGSGFSLYHTLVSAASTNATLVKNSVGTIGTLILTNSSATWAYFKFVNKASAPTVGTDTAVINIGVAPNSTLDCSTSFAGLRLTTGIAYYVSGGPSLTDNTALLASGTFLVNMTYV